MIISIVGLPNSGKSTLINTLSKRKVSITDMEPNTTRDYVSINADIDGTSIELIDLPGYIESTDEYLNIFQKNLSKNLDKSDLIFLVIDSKNPNQHDMDKLIKNIRKYSEKIWLIINKVDDFEKISLENIAYNYQFQKEFHISAYHKKGIELLKENIKEFASQSFIKDMKENSSGRKLSIIGRPNVGKSSLFNSILNYERSGISDIPGTTLDVISEVVVLEDTVFEISDTAGIPRKKQKNSK